MKRIMPDRSGYSNYTCVGIGKLGQGLFQYSLQDGANLGTKLSAATATQLWINFYRLPRAIQTLTKDAYIINILSLQIITQTNNCLLNYDPFGVGLLDLYASMQPSIDTQLDSWNNYPLTTDIHIPGILQPSTNYNFAPLPTPLIPIEAVNTDPLDLSSLDNSLGAMSQQISANEQAQAQSPCVGFKIVVTNKQQGKWMVTAGQVVINGPPTPINIPVVAHVTPPISNLSAGTSHGYKVYVAISRSVTTNSTTGITTVDYTGTLYYYNLATSAPTNSSTIIYVYIGSIIKICSDDTRPTVYSGNIRTILANTRNPGVAAVTGICTYKIEQVLCSPIAITDSMFPPPVTSKGAKGMVIITQQGMMTQSFDHSQGVLTQSSGALSIIQGSTSDTYLSFNGTDYQFVPISSGTSSATDGVQVALNGIVAGVVGYSDNTVLTYTNGGYQFTALPTTPTFPTTGQGVLYWNAANSSLSLYAVSSCTST